MSWPKFIKNQLEITNKPALIKYPNIVPGSSDHCTVVTELDIDPPYRCTKPRPVRQFKKANWEAIRQQIRSCWTSFSENIDAWTNLYRLKWLPLGKIYLGYPNHSLHLYIAKPSVRRKLTFGQNINYINGRPSVPLGLPGGLFEKQTFWIFRTKRSKPLWRYIKSKREYGNGVSPLKWNESGFRPPLCTYRLNWARRTSWGWWDDWDDTVLQTQDSKFEPWRSEAEHATSRSRRLPTILTFTRGWGRNNFVSFKTPRPGTEPRTLAWKAAVLTTTPGPPPCLSLEGKQQAAFR